MVVGVALSGCCHEIGCIDGLAIELGSAADHFAPGAPVQATVCVDGNCVTDTLTRNAESGLLDGGPLSHFEPNQLLFRGIPGGSHSVTVELSREGAVVFGASREMVSTSTFMPNGPFCPPVCHNASITL